MSWEDTLELALSFSEVEVCVNKKWENIKKKMEVDIYGCDNMVIIWEKQ